jgi:hypothetical protein
MKRFRVFITALMIVFMLTGFCYALSADPAGRPSPGGNVPTGGYTPVYTPLPQATSHAAKPSPTLAPIEGDLNPMKIPQTPKSEASETPGVTASVPEPVKPKADNLPIIAIAAAVVLIIIGAGVLIYAKRKHDSEY